LCGRTPDAVSFPDRLLRVTTTNTRGGPAPASAAPTTTLLGRSIVRVLTSTDHKVIGKLYLATSFAWFLIAGLMAMVIRSELAFPGQQLVNDELYNQLFTMHGTIMLLLFATPRSAHRSGTTSSSSSFTSC
jgi:cytochrome c oxidase subunit I